MILKRDPCQRRKREILALLEDQDATEGTLHELTLYVLVRGVVAATGTCFRVPGPILMMDLIAVRDGFRPVAKELLTLLLDEARRVRDRHGYRVIYLTSPDPSLPDLIGGDVWRGETGQSFFGGAVKAESCNEKGEERHV